jgi:predicted nucleotidyltransferase
LDSNTLSLRKRIAREAANLLYSGCEKEYKQAKLKASKTLRSRNLPTNLEVAVELDRIAEENEGLARQDRLIRMRKEALNLMQILRDYNPLLIGSVWRGTIHHDSDIDIVIYNDQFDEALKILAQNSVRIIQARRVVVTKKGKRKGAFHVLVETPTGGKAEIRVTSSEEAAVKVKCKIYGDQVVGLRTTELERVIKENPIERFIPF